MMENDPVSNPMVTLNAASMMLQIIPNIGDNLALQDAGVNAESSP